MSVKNVRVFLTENINAKYNFQVNKRKKQNKEMWASIKKIKDVGKEGEKRRTHNNQETQSKITIYY